MPVPDRVDRVRPLWESMGEDERRDMLTADLGTLRQRAKETSEKARAQAVEEAGESLDLSVEASLEEILEEGLRRLQVCV